MKKIEWRSYDPIGFDPGHYNKDRMLQIHKAEAKRRARLWAQDVAAGYLNARNVRITVDAEVEVTKEPYTKGRHEYYSFRVGARVTGTADTTEYNPNHSSARAYREIFNLENSPTSYAQEDVMKVRVNGQDYPMFIWDSSVNRWRWRESTSYTDGSLIPVVGDRTTVNGTEYTLTDVIHQINLDGTIVFGVEGVERRSSGGCQEGCPPWTLDD